MNLQDQAGIELSLLKGGIDIYHGDLDQIGGCALNRGVGRSPLAELPDIDIGGLQFRDITPSPQHRLDKTILIRFFNRIVEPGSDLTVTLVISSNIFMRLRHRNTQVPRQPKIADPVYNAEIDRLGDASLLRGHFLDRHPKKRSRRRAVDIQLLLKSSQQLRILRQVSQNPQLNLSIVGIEQNIS